MMGRYNFVIAVEFLGGTHIKEAATDMISFSQQTGCGVRTSFNGVRLCAFPHTTADSLVDEYAAATRPNEMED